MNKLKYLILLLFIVKSLAIPSLIPAKPSPEKGIQEGGSLSERGSLVKRENTLRTVREAENDDDEGSSLLEKEDLKKKATDEDEEDDDDKDGKDDKSSKSDDDDDDKKDDDGDDKDSKGDDGGDDSENDSKSDKSQTDSKSDDTSEENENPDSKSNPDTEEEGDSSSASNTSEEKDDSSQSNTTENDEDESETTSEETSEESDSESDSSDSKSDEENKLLVILLDGVRPDYLTRDERKLKFLQRIKESGSIAKYVKPVFPSNPFPNWYSIATGKYPERHGIINDYMYDAKRKELFLKASSKDKFWWDSAEPIWITAKKQRKRVHVSWWTGCDVEIKKHLPTFCDPYQDKMTEDEKYPQLVADRLKEIIRGFERDDFDLALLYYEAVGDAGRKFGPDSKRTKKAFRTIDKILDDLLDQLEEKKLADSVNVVILSDTGMVSSNNQRVINLEKYVDFNDIVKLVGEGAFVMIQPEKRKTESVSLLHQSDD